MIEESIYHFLGNENIKSNFEKEIKGYHLIHKTQIKENVWEEININIVRDVIKTDWVDGTHFSGKDMCIGEWSISNKTVKMNKKNNISMSSYRLTNVTNPINHNIPESILDEIKKRDQSYNYYSLLLRSKKQNIITYYWCVIPKTYFIFDLRTQTLEKKYNKQGEVVGWCSEYSSITFSMSSQLWFHFRFEDIQQFIIHQVDVCIQQNTMTFAQIYTLLGSNV